MTLNEYTVRRINHVIEESGIGVSDEVEFATDTVIGRIKKKLRKKCEEPFSFTIDFCGRQIGIQVFFSYESDGISAAWLQKIGWINVYVKENMSFEEELDLYDSVQHELEHAYQNIKMGKGFGSQEMYMYAIQHLFSDDIYERSLANIVYVCTRSEQDAFINGAYAYVKSNWGPMPVDELMKKTEAYAWLQNLYKAVNVLKKNKTEIKPYIHPYTEIDGTFNYGKFMRIALKGIHEFEWKMARLVKGMKKRFLLEFNVHPQMPSRNMTKTWLWQLR